MAVDWHGPVMLEGTYGHYVWRAAAHGDRAYLCGRRKHHFEHSDEPEPPAVESALLESKDGLVWSKAGLFQEKNGDETAFLFEPDGEILAVARGGGRHNAELCRSRPPYQHLGTERPRDGKSADRWSCDGEMHLLVGGRKSIGDARTSLYWLIDGKLHEFAELTQRRGQLLSGLRGARRESRPGSRTTPATSATRAAGRSRPSIWPSSRASPDIRWFNKNTRRQRPGNGCYLSGAEGSRTLDLCIANRDQPQPKNPCFHGRYRDFSDSLAVCKSLQKRANLRWMGVLRPQGIN